MSLLPYSFRCLHHINYFMARNLPLSSTGNPGESDNNASNNDIVDAHRRQQSYGSSSDTLSPVASSHTLRDPSGAGPSAPHPQGHAAPQECFSLVIRSAVDDSVLYDSEPCSGTLHPTWRWLPSELLDTHGTARTFVIELCRGPVTTATRASDSIMSKSGTDCVFLRFYICTQSSFEYVAASVTEADMLQTNKNTCHPELFAVCFDGVYRVQSAAPHVITTTDGSSGSVAWSTSPAGSGKYIHSNDNSTHHSASAQRMTIGDAAALTSATIAWQTLASFQAERRAAQLLRLDETASTQHLTAAESAMTSVLQARLSDLHEQLTLAVLELEQVRQQVVSHQHILEEHEESCRLLDARTEMAEESNAASSLSVRQDEILRANLRSQLARCCQQRVRELSRMYPIELTESYGSVSQPARKSKDTINHAALPALMPADRSGTRDTVVAVSADDLYDEALALGHAAHVTHALAVLYGCVLPHPLLLGGTRSAVMRHADMPPSQLTVSAASVSVGDAAWLPLYCLRGQEQPVMRAAVEMLVRDCKQIARAMGKNEEKLSSFGLRVGAVLQYLLSEDA